LEFTKIPHFSPSALLYGLILEHKHGKINMFFVIFLKKHVTVQHPSIAFAKTSAKASVFAHVTDVCC